MCFFEISERTDRQTRWSQYFAPRGAGTNTTCCCLHVDTIFCLIRHRASRSSRWHFAFGLCCYSNEIRAPIANPPNSAQLPGTPYHSSKLHPGPCTACSVGVMRGTDRHRRPWPLYISHRIRLTRNVTSGQIIFGYLESAFRQLYRQNLYPISALRFYAVRERYQGFVLATEKKKKNFLFTRVVTFRRSCARKWRHVFRTQRTGGATNRAIGNTDSKRFHVYSCQVLTDF